MIKQLIRFAFSIAALFILLTTGGCYKDKGNYDYINIDTIRIAYNAAGGEYTVLQFDTLRIQPVISLSSNAKASNLKYEWSARLIDPSVATQNFPVIIISNQKNIDTAVSLVPAKYRVTYKITDTVSTRSSYLQYTVNVTSSFSEGWLLMQQIDNTGDVAVVTSSGKLLNKAYSSVNGASLPTNIKRIDIAKRSPQEIYLIAENEGVEVSPVSFGKIKSFNNWFFYPPAIQKPGINVYLTPPNGSNCGVAINDGHVHIRRFGGFPPPVLYGSEIMLNGNINYKMAPYIAMGTFSASLYMAAMYETNSKRFIGLQGDPWGLDGNLVAFTAANASAAYDPNNVGMDLVYMGASRQTAVHNAIMRSGSDLYLLQLNLGLPQVATLKQKMNAADIANISAAVNSLQLDYIYYAAGNKIYMYEIGPNSSSVIYEFPAGENVTTLNVDPDRSSGTELMATTWNGTTGNAYQFTIATTGRFANNTYTGKYEGVGKVVYTKYKSK